MTIPEGNAQINKLHSLPYRVVKEVFIEIANWEYLGNAREQVWGIIEAMSEEPNGVAGELRKTMSCFENIRAPSF